MPRFSTTIYDDKGRAVGIACGHRRRKKCATCGSEAGLECDGCDKPLCKSCAVSPKAGVDICPKCFDPAWRRWLWEQRDSPYKPSLMTQKERRLLFRGWARAFPGEFLELVKLSASGEAAAALGRVKQPRELWAEAGGRIAKDGTVTDPDPEKFRKLMQAHGHIVVGDR
jgi:hypothetical protein